MFRAIANSFFSLLLVASLLWGGCVSCEQFFMFSKNDCCHKDKCGTSDPRTAPEDCAIMPVIHVWASGAQSEIAAISASLPAYIADAVNPLLPPGGRWQPDINFIPFDASSPGLPVLNASLLI